MSLATRGVARDLCAFTLHGAGALALALALAACGLGGSYSSGGGSNSKGNSGSNGDSNSGGDSGDTEGETDSGWGDSSGDLPPGFWPGVACQTEAEEQKAAGRPVIHFDIDAGVDPDKDFFRLPFPNDIRRAGAGLDLRGFPTPPLEFTEDYGDIVDRWLDALEQDVQGFAVNGAALFRATHPMNLGNASQSVRIINIDPDHPDHGKAVSALSFRSEGGPPSRTSYICQNWMGVEPVDGLRLDNDTTYAYVVTTGVTPLDASAGAFSPDDDFTAMLGSAAPGDARLAAAWERYAPLRAFLGSSANTGPGGPQLTAGDLLAAAVVTTAPGPDTLVAGRDAIDQAPPPELVELKACDGQGESPCASGPGLTEEERAARRCGAESASYLEIHGRLRLPIFQQGVAPYASEGGGIASPVKPVTSEDVCFALTVPKSQAPEDGWPVLIFGHGTGGGFRGAIGMAEGAATRGLATLTIEGVMHGARRHDVDDAPGDGLVGGLDTAQLVFNFLNPASARDTTLQAALDVISTARWVRGVTPDAFPEGLGLETGLDADNMFYFGHSQGAQAGALALAVEPTLRTAALSGVGSTLPHALLEKQLPLVTVPGTDLSLSVAELLHLAFVERPTHELSSFHPLMILLNTYVNRADADVYALQLMREPPELEPSDPPVEPPARSVLLYAGHVDSYTPLRSAVSLMIASGIPRAGASVVPPPCDAYEGGAEVACSLIELGFVTTTDAPVSGNKHSGRGTSAALMLPASGGEDGHFVALQPKEQGRLLNYFESALYGGVPVIE